VTTPNTNAPAASLPPAATLLLLRDGRSSVEVLMMRRQRQLRFMGGMWVFPGGRLDPSDYSPAATALLAEADRRGAYPMRSLDGTELPNEVALGLKVAACRETYEETGLLLARHRDGHRPSPADVHALQAERARVASLPGAFIELIASAGLLLEVDGLVYWSHWITPSLEPRRYDTRFFAAVVPDGQAASADQQESTELGWLAPRDALVAEARGEMSLAPPTLLTLEDLEESHRLHGSVAAMLAAERNRATPPVMPRIVRDGDATISVMPWDPAYADMPGEGCTLPDGYPPHLARRRGSVTFRRETAVH
jgi:8-oxo-dGTP pyrophosphatase MutT (NUDIX family)